MRIQQKHYLFSSFTGQYLHIHSGYTLFSASTDYRYVNMIRSTSNCGSSLFLTENVVSNYMSFIGLTQYDWENPTMMDGPDDPDPKTAKQARGTIQYGPDEEDPRQAEEPYRRFIGIVLYGGSENGDSRKPSSKK